PDLVIVDPPRAGLGKEAAALLAAVRPEHITYVSCDPATLSRDLKSLLDSGYHLRAMRMVDLFPQTFHLESVAELSL
ncbi:MAG TPA: 23S rRNA (uracil(1939)-C(5))-methyltransferase RlmD, partial [Acidobacteriaceae bacterium]|nr:23S rRNA (uracil(1939)-C(5))-methyltransferase RlmD [Acidobacteriaceae bacterium]